MNCFTKDNQLIKKAWKTFELKEVCKKMGLYPNEKGELIKNGIRK